MFAGKPYQSESIHEPFDAIVIGSGLGGLTAASLLAKSGLKVLVLERHWTAGGLTHTYVHEGYECEVGFHYLNDSIAEKENLTLREIFNDITNGQLKWASMKKIYDRFIFPDATYEMVAGRNSFVDTLAGYFPEERKTLELYLKMVDEFVHAHKIFYALYTMPPWIKEILSPILSKKFLHYSDRTGLEVLKTITQNPKLIGVLTARFAMHALPPGQSSFITTALPSFGLLDGGAYPVGGPSQIARTIEAVIEQNGGKVMVGAEVKEILIVKNRAVGVKMKNDDEITAPIIISNAGIWNTLHSLLPESISSQFKIYNSLKNIKFSKGNITLSVGFKQDASSLGLESTNTWIFPGYDHDANFNAYQADPLSAPFPTLFITCPSAKDPDWNQRYPGKSTLDIMVSSSYEHFSKWDGTEWRKRGEDYLAYKEKFSQRMLDQLYTYMPQLKGKVDFYELATPLTMKHFHISPYGDMTGLEHTPARFRQKCLCIRTPIPNLFLTGHDVLMGGIAPALFSGVLAASIVLKRNLLRNFATKSPKNKKRK